MASYSHDQDLQHSPPYSSMGTVYRDWNSWQFHHESCAPWRDTSTRSLQSWPCTPGQSSIDSNWLKYDCRTLCNRYARKGEGEKRQKIAASSASERCPEPKSPQTNAMLSYGLFQYLVFQKNNKGFCGLNSVPQGIITLNVNCSGSEVWNDGQKMNGGSVSTP